MIEPLKLKTVYQKMEQARLQIEFWKFIRDLIKRGRVVRIKGGKSL